MMSSLAQQQTSVAGRKPRLTKNDRLVLTALESAEAPLKAYDLLERLKVQGIGAPMTVYRALDRLQKQGLVHKLDGLGAFMVCSHGHPHEVETFIICRDCEKVEEIKDGAQRLHDVAHHASDNFDFKADLIRVEIRGTCKDCAA
ncbi:Fur family transcriptional regulator [Parvularcula maris]|uniref:Transcriptional repressor n=1 Tax=Parvularcula maris TaxID=2965077 RepID=A0A9X2LAZ3_9PROT|nr:Fur family transcriptional regulator [Parvularcula maris]MCQ8186398.1 transcriptional repressor [Parvularcula maris]